MCLKYMLLAKNVIAIILFAKPRKSLGANKMAAIKMQKNSSRKVRERSDVSGGRRTR
jgi:hypothetical protein